MSRAPSRPPSRGWQVLRASLRSQQRSILLGVVLGLVWTAGKVAVPSLVRLAIDRGIVASQPGALLRWVLAILAVGVVTALCTGARRYLAFSAALRAETSLRQRLFAQLQRLHFGFHDHAQTGQLMSRAGTDLQQIQGFVVMIPITVQNALTVVSVAVLLVAIHPTLAVLALGGLPLLNLFATRFSRQIHPVALELQQELAGVATTVEETVSGIRVVKGFGAEALQATRLRRGTSRVFDRAMAAARVRARFLPVLDFLPALGLVVVLWYGGHQVLAGRLTVGELVAFNSYVVMLIWPLRMTGMLIAQAQRAVVSAQRIDEVLSTEPLVADPPDARPLPPGGGEIRFEDVRFGYGDGAVPVLDGFDLTIAAGEAVAVVGATGSGKSTVARLIPRFYDLQAGRILIDGVDVRALRLADLRRSVGIVFEETFLFSDSVRSNIAFADPGAAPERVERAARLAGADQFVAELPDGYDTSLGERGFSLSGGQRQRLALARAILADPRVLILDDATSAVDPTKEHEIRGALAAVMAGRTTVVIAHRAATIALADRVVLLDGGRIVAEGTHDSLLATSPRYAEILAQAEQLDGERAATVGAGEDGVR